MTARLNLAEIEEGVISPRFKGIRADRSPFLVRETASQRWNLLREDLALPALVLKQSALEHNRAWMRRFIAHTGLKLAPHGKTPLSPQLFQMQLDDGAWAITCATGHHLQLYRSVGVQRIFFANQLGGKPHIRYVCEELRRDPQFDFYTLVDSVEGVEALSAAAAEARLSRPIQVLIETGVPGKRAGCRTVEEAMAIARLINRHKPALALRGIEGYEGVLISAGTPPPVERINAYYDQLLEVAASCDSEKLFADGEILLSAGCTSTLDLAWKRLRSASLSRPTSTIVRSGCYLTSDSGAYQNAFAEMLRRSPELQELGDPPKAALELWGDVSSAPEPDLAIINFGRRDAPYDKGLPIPKYWFRPGAMDAPRLLLPDSRIDALHDQHAILRYSEKGMLRVGDLVGVGISHPCAAFERWPLVLVVDDAYTVIGAIRTFFD